MAWGKGSVRDRTYQNGVIVCVTLGVSDGLGLVALKLGLVFVSGLG